MSPVIWLLFSLLIQDPLTLHERYAAASQASSRLSAGDFKESIRLAESYLNQDIEGDVYRPWVLDIKAKALKETGCFDEAFEVLSELIIDFDPEGPYTEAQWVRDTARALATRAQVEMDLGLLELAAQSLNEFEEHATLIAEDPGDGRPGPEALHDWLTLEGRLASIVDDHAKIDDLFAVFGDEPSLTPIQRFRLHKTLAISMAKRAVDRSSGFGEARSLFLDVPESEGETTEFSRDHLDFWFAHAWLELMFGEFESALAPLQRAQIAIAESRKKMPFREAYLAALRAMHARLTNQPVGVLELHLQELGDAFDEFCRAARKSPLRPGGVSFFYLRVRRMVLGELIHLCSLLGKDSEGFGFLLQSQSMGSLTRDLPVPDLKAVRQSLLKPGCTLLAYFPSDGATHLFVLDQEELETFQLPPGYRLRPMIERARFVVETPPRPGESDWRKTLGKISSQLIPQSVRQRLESSSHVFLSGRSLMGNAPFEALPWGKSETLGTAVTMSDFPSIPLCVHLSNARPNATPADLDILCVAAPDEANPIPFGTQHRERLSASFPKSRFLLGDKVTWDDLRRALDRSPKVLHLLLHGYHDSSRERPACLCLSPSSSETQLSCDMLEELPLPRHLIFSACGAARGPSRIGDDGVETLSGASFRAPMGSVESLLISSGELPFDATFALIERYHQYLASGKSPSESRRLASRDIAQSEGWNHPYYFAQMRVVGLGDRALFKVQSAPRRLWFVGVAVLLLVAAILGWRRRPNGSLRA